MAASSPAANLMPNRFSIAMIRLMWAIESQPSMSVEVVVSSMPSSSSPNTRLKTSWSSVWILSIALDFPDVVDLRLPGLVDRQFPRALPLLVLGRAREAERVVQVANDAVFGGWNVLADQSGQPPRLGQRDQVVQHERLDATLQNATAHQPGVDHQRVVLGLGQEHA